MVRTKNIIIISEQFLQRNQMFDYFSQTEFMISKGGGIIHYKFHIFYQNLYGYLKDLSF